MLFHKMTPPEAKDCCPIGTATTQKRSPSSRFVDEIFANAGEVKRKKKKKVHNHSTLTKNTAWGVWDLL